MLAYPVAELMKERKVDSETPLGYALLVGGASMGADGSLKYHCSEMMPLYRPWC